jgi:hypothetical protein
MRPADHRAVMASRSEPPDSLDFFPTPPWATRALLECVVGTMPRMCCCWEPAAGEGHMAAVLGEVFAEVWRTDVHDYGGLHRVGSFVGEGPDVIEAPIVQPHWIITNPPFNLAVEFAERALIEAQIGVALLVRTSWLEGGERYRRLFRDRPPAMVAQFSERVPMVKGRWDPAASTATSYCWVVWHVGCVRQTRLMWIPPGCRERLTKPGDVERWAHKGAGDA